MNTSYQIVSESLRLNLSNTAIASGLLAIGAWILNKKIRTKKVLNRYPTPAALRRKLEECPIRKVRIVAGTLRDDMDPAEYKYWIGKNLNPKLGVGKAILLFLFAPATTVWQGGKAAVNAGQDPDKIIDRAINNKYGMFGV